MVQPANSLIVSQKNHPPLVSKSRTELVVVPRTELVVVPPTRTEVPPTRKGVVEAMAARPLAPSEAREMYLLSLLLDPPSSIVGGANTAQRSSSGLSQLLHEYNDVKDVTQNMLSIVAESRGSTLCQLQWELGLPLE